jgi:hemerythrin-like domain-containing protein
MLTTDTLRDEHNGVLVVLDHLDRAVGAAERGVPVPADIFADIQEFFAVFVDRCHHAKEEQVLFPALGTEGAALQHELEQQHVRGRRLAGAYASAVAGFRPGDRVSTEPVATSARRYTEFLRDHIDLETGELFPLIEHNLSAGEDGNVIQAFERIEEEQIGPGTHERLHGMIAGLGPRIDAAIAAVGA